MSVADKDREDVKAAIRKRGVTLTGLAIQNGYTGSAVRRALGHPWPKVEKLIAEFLDTEPKDIWPSRYQQDGTPRSSEGTKRDNRHRRRRRHRQKTT